MLIHMFSCICSRFVVLFVVGVLVDVVTSAADSHVILIIIVCSCAIYGNGVLCLYC